MLHIKPTQRNELDDAFEIVLDLAFQNIVDKFDNPTQYRKQMAAYKLIRNTFTREGELR